MRNRFCGCLLALWAAAASALTIDGTVTWPAGTPPVAAQVGARVDDATYMTDLDATGRWRLDLPLDTGDEVVVLLRGAGVFGWYHGPAGARLSLVAVPTVPRGGELRDQEGQPVANATVTVTAIGLIDGLWWPWPEAPWPALGASTDARGRWSLDGLPAALRLELYADHPDYLPTRVVGEVPSSATLTRAMLEHGRVVRADGRPAAGVTVFMPGRWGRQGAPPSATTNQRGEFTLRSRQDREFIVQDRATGLVCAPRRDEEGGPPKEVTLTAVPGVVLNVLAVDSVSGQPVPGVTITPTLSGQALSRPWLGRTDADGRASLLLPPGQVTLALTRGHWRAEPFDPLTLRSGEPPRALKALLGRTRTVWGQLSEVGGAALSGVTVSTTPPTRAPVVRDLGRIPPPRRDDPLAPIPMPRRRSASGASPGTTDHDGRFALPDVPTTGKLTLYLTEPCGFLRPPLTVDAESLPAGLWRVAVPLAPRADLVGRLRTAAGEPLPDVSVALGLRREGAAEDEDQGEPPAALTAVTDREGRFRFEQVPLAVEPFLSAHARHCAPLTPCPVARVGDGWAAAELTLRPFDGRVTGRVVDAAGQPLTGAVVLAVGLAGAETVTDAAGRFALEKLPPGKLQLLALHGDEARALAKVALGADVTLKAAPVPPLTEEDEHELAAQLLRRELLAVEPGEQPDAEMLMALAVADPPGAIELLAKLPTQPVADALVAQTLLALAHTAPALCLDQLGRLDRLRDPEARYHARLGVALEIVGRHPEAAARLYDALKDAPPVQAREPQAIDLATLAARLGRPEAPRLAAAALRGADEHRRAYAAWQWGDLPPLAPLPLAAARDEEERAVLVRLAALGLVRRDPRAALRDWRAAPGQLDRQLVRQGDAWTRLLAGTCAQATDAAAVEAFADGLPPALVVAVYHELALRATSPDAARRLTVKAVLASPPRDHGDEATTMGLFRTAQRTCPELAGVIATRLAELTPADPDTGPYVRAQTDVANRLLLHAERFMARRPDGLDRAERRSLGDLANWLVWFEPRRAAELQAAGPDGGATADLAALLVTPWAWRGRDDVLPWVVSPHAAAWEECDNL